MIDTPGISKELKALQKNTRATSHRATPEEKGLRVTVGGQPYRFSKAIAFIFAPDLSAAIAGKGLLPMIKSPGIYAIPATEYHSDTKREK